MYYFWDVFNAFFLSVVVGSLVKTIRDIVENPGAIGTFLGNALPKSDNFFINYLALRALGLVPMKLILHNAVFNQLQTFIAKIIFKYALPLALAASHSMFNTSAHASKLQQV
jgi:hypothetical protein